MQIGLTVSAEVGLVSVALVAGLVAGMIHDLDVGTGAIGLAVDNPRVGLAVGILDNSAVGVAVGLVIDT